MNRLVFAPCLITVVTIGFCAALTRGDDQTDDLLRRGMQSAEEGDSKQAVKLLDQAIKADAKLAAAYYWRGREHFRLGDINKSVADLDRFVTLRPAVESRQWERGISYYYAGQYEKGAKQFELYQTYHDNDVENSTWRFLCMAKTDGVAKAREALLPIKNDRRVPMMQIYAMFRGEMTAEDVLKSCREGEPGERALNSRLFYAHLYIGLLNEALGNAELAGKHIRKAAKEHRIGHYMWDVARVHAAQLESKKKP